MGNAGMREVFRGDLPSVELAAGVLEDLGIESQRRWEMAGGAQFTAGETALAPGRTAVLLVPTIVYEEAMEALAGFHAPEGDHLTELTGELQENERRRKSVAMVILLIMVGPLALAIIGMVTMLIRSIFE
jgi:hypothetical protein